MTKDVEVLMSKELREKSGDQRDLFVGLASWNRRMRFK